MEAVSCARGSKARAGVYAFGTVQSERAKTYSLRATRAYFVRILIILIQNSGKQQQEKEDRKRRSTTVRR